MLKNKLKDIKFDYSWVILGICFLVVFTSLGLCSSGRNMYLTAITGALNIPRGAFSINHSIRFITTTIINLYFGALINKFGPKKLICTGFICLIGFALINATAEKLIYFYFASVLLGLGLSWTTTAMTSVVIRRWFTKNIGTLTGAVLAANGIGGAIAVQIISPIIFEEGNPFGYRNSYILVSIILSVVFFIILFFFKDKPKNDDNSSFDVSKKKKTRGEGWEGLEFNEIIRKPYFYMALASVLFTGMALQGLGGIYLPYVYDLGIDVEFVAIITSFGGILLTLTKFGVGFMYDKFGLKISMNICYTCMLLSLISIMFVANTPLGKSVMFFRSFVGCIASPLETVMIPLIASSLFGNKCFDKVLGIFVSVNYAGFAIASPLGNIIYDIKGDYSLSFVIFTIFEIFTIIAMQFVLRGASKDRKKFEEAKALEAAVN